MSEYEKVLDGLAGPEACASAKSVLNLLIARKHPNHQASRKPLFLASDVYQNLKMSTRAK